MTLPRATYRLQLRREFGFTAAAAIVPYLHQLGVSHVYASPITQARAGSTHGYDVIDSNRLNDELGGEAGFAELSAALRNHQMGLIVDFVPNHMAASVDNPWWYDVLRHGRSSKYATTFDIDWETKPGFRFPTVTLPVLSEPLEQALGGGKIRIIKAGDAAVLDVGGLRLPCSSAAQDFVRQRMNSGDVGQDGVEQLLRLQHYRLIDWHDAATQINYRRFFDINDLVGLNVADPVVFARLHGLIAKLCVAGQVDGVRLDHIDGLRDPAEYCERLQQLLRSNGMASPYIIVEKILDADETMPDFPGISGTTGYEALTLLTRLFVDGPGLVALDLLWRDICNGCDAQEMRRAAKRQIIAELFPGAFDKLSDRLQRLAPQPLDERATVGLRGALQAYLIALPVYRSYVSARGVSERDRALIEATIAAAQVSSDVAASSFAVLQDALTLRLESDRAEQLEFVLRLQQFSGPLMAKAVEDTLFYRDFRLLALNEVGGDVAATALAADEFHQRVERRAATQPGGLVATATHDTKRGEDARLRITALSSLSADWKRLVPDWLKDSQNSGVRPAHRYMLLQALVGGWPLDGVTPEFVRRVKEYAVKALREGKTDSSWTQPNAQYEQATQKFIDDLLSGQRSKAFIGQFEPLASRAALLGALSSLTQVTLKFTLPGVPDIYQGCEGWDLSFVDPDNRRPVDYVALQAILQRHPEPDWPSLCKDWRSGAIKLHLTHALLELRSRHPQLFASGDYESLECLGRDGQKMMAFTRRYGQQIVVVCACRSFADLSKGGEMWPDWSRLQGELALPSEYAYVDGIDGRELREHRVSLAERFEHLPALVLIGIKQG